MPELWCISLQGERRVKHPVFKSVHMCYNSSPLDIAIHAQEILKTRKILNGLYANHTGQPLDVIEKVMERDYFMSAQEAVKFGLVDKVIDKRKI